MGFGFLGQRAAAHATELWWLRQQHKRYNDLCDATLKRAAEQMRVVGYGCGPEIDPQSGAKPEQ